MCRSSIEIVLEHTPLPSFYTGRPNPSRWVSRDSGLAAIDPPPHKHIIAAMLKKTLRCCVPGAVLFLLCGCHAPAPPPPDGHSAIQLQLADAAEFDRLWDVTTTVLRNHEFYPVREDRASGLIVTTPVTSQQWFEFWRHDVDDADSLVEASVHTVRRAATVRIDRGSVPETYLLVVQIDKQRLSLPDRQITAPGSAYGAFGSRLPTTAGQLVSAAEAQTWLPAGRDPVLEDNLLRQIVKRYRPLDYEIVQLAGPAGEGDAAEQGVTTQPGTIRLTP
jgi:hypothetical protein